MKQYIYWSVAVMMLCSCSHRREVKENIPVIKTETVRMEGASDQATFSGKVRAAEDVNLAFKVSGTLQKTVREGAFVRKGEVLAQMDARDYQIQLDATEAEYQQIKGEAERVIQLYNQNSVSKNDYEKAVYGLQQITAKRNAHANALADTRLKAPFDGYVQRLFFHTGELVSQGLPVVSFYSNATPEVELNVPAAVYMQRERFQQFYATVDVNPGVRYPLDLISIATKANMNQLYTVKLKMDPVEGQVLPTPGMIASVTLCYRPANSTRVVVPLSAVVHTGEDSFVWVYNPAKETVEKRAVQVTEVQQNGTAIVEGDLKGSEQVVCAGVHKLVEGQRVKVLVPPSKTNIGGLL